MLFRSQPYTGMSAQDQTKKRKLDQSQTECFFCKKQGHWKRSCPLYIAYLDPNRPNKKQGTYMITPCNFSIFDTTAWVLDGVGYKIPTAEVLSRINSERTPSGLLREPGSAHNFNRKEDFARTPMGAGLCRQLQLPVSSVRTPTGAGLHT